MFHSGLTKPEHELRNLLRFWVVAFFAVGVVFAAVPHWVVQVLNQMADVVRWQGPALSDDEGHLWQVLAVSLMGTLVMLASRAIKELGRSLLLVRIIVCAKLISTLGFVVAFVWSEPVFAYLVAAMVDGVVAGLTYFYYRQVVALKGSQ